MAQQLDWPRYTRWTWIIAVIALIILLWMWLSGRGPGSAASCCGAAPIAATPAAPVPAAPAAPAAPAPVTHQASWDGNKLTLQGTVPDDASKKAIVDAAVAKYGAANVIDKLTVDATAKGLITVALQGSVASEAVKAARGDEAKAIYPMAVIDNQLSIAAGPAATAQDVQCGDTIAVAATFATGSAQLTQGARKLLDAVVPCIKAPYEVGGHTDNVGNPAANQALSERRAKSVAAYLASKGIDSQLLRTKGYGDAAPIGDNASAEGKAKNRRIEFKKL